MHTFSRLNSGIPAAILWCAAFTLQIPTNAHTAEKLPPFQEVYDALKQHLTDVSGDELNRAAVTGLLDQLRSRARLAGIESGNAAPAVTNAPGLGARTFDGRFGYVRLTGLTDGIEREFDSALKTLATTNQLRGLVVDLRSAANGDYPAAVALAERFIHTAQPLVDWGDGWRNSTEKSNAFTRPVALLVNRDTAGAAEAFAGILRHRGVALIVGTNTAGAASKMRLVSLKDGHQLRVAVAPLKVADGIELPRTGIRPDIAIAVTPENEQAWISDPYKSLTIASNSSTPANLASAETNRAPRRRLNEAELVRMSRDGENNERTPVAANPSLPSEPPVPFVQDPALARALDVLKGLAIVQQFRAP